MPTLVWRYLTALLYDRTSATCVALAEALQTVSHDRLTRLLPADWSGQRLLEGLPHPVRRERGYLILDDTVIPKPFATAIEGLAWVFSSQARQPCMASPSCCWSGRMGGADSLRHAAVAQRWPLQIGVGPGAPQLCPQPLALSPEYVLFDAWYPSKALLKRIRDDGWYFVCRLQKNRRFNGQPLRAYRRHPYWTESGWLSGGLKVLVVRYGAKYFATNRLTLPAAQVRRLYRVRAQIEEVIRVCKDQLGLNGCQARTERAQQHHLTCCLVAFCVLERERQDRGLTIYTLKRQLSCRG